MPTRLVHVREANAKCCCGREVDVTAQVKVGRPRVRIPRDVTVFSAKDPICVVENARTQAVTGQERFDERGLVVTRIPSKNLDHSRAVYQVKVANT